jgi:tripartite-type tricarboxylate transporter receptor subunit TctC
LAQDTYPSRPITLIVPFGPASGTDVIARLLVEHMSRNMKATIVVENKAGANGQIAAEFVARAQPDGHTLLMATNSTHSAAPFLYKSLRYDPVGGFAPIGRATLNPLTLLVRAESPYRTAQEVLAYGRDNPGKLSYGYGNTGSQVAGAILSSMARLKAVAVPYKSTPQAMTDLVGGQIDFTFVDVAGARALLDGGKLRALAVTTDKRFAPLPNVPAMREVPGLEEFATFSWVGLVAPAGTPPAIVSRLNRELRAALETPEVRHQLEQRSRSIVEPTTVEEFAAFLEQQQAVWKRRIAESGIQPE